MYGDFPFILFGLFLLKLRSLFVANIVVSVKFGNWIYEKTSIEKLHPLLNFVCNYIKSKLEKSDATISCYLLIILNLYNTRARRLSCNALQMRFDKEKTRNICFLSWYVIFFVHAWVICYCLKLPTFKALDCSVINDYWN